MLQSNQGKKPVVFKDYENIAELFYSGATFVAFDTETTGLKPSSDYLTEIGAVKFNYDEELGSFDQLIKPPVPIPAFLEQLTHITNEMVSSCPCASSVIEDFLMFLGGKETILIAHNALFDLGFLNAEMERMNRPIIPNMTIDSLPFSRWVHPEFRSESEKGQYKLQMLAKRFNVEVRSAHRADDDARVLKEIFLKIMNDALPMQKNFDMEKIRRPALKASDQLELF